MRLRSLAIRHAVGFLVVAGCGAIQLAVLARALSADQLGVVLSCMAWVTTLGELIDCRTWEVYATHCKRNQDTAREALGQLLRYECRLALAIALSGAALTWSFSFFWKPVLGPLSLLVCVSTTALSGTESLLRTAMVRLQMFTFVWKSQIYVSIFGSALALLLFWRDSLTADTGLVLISSTRVILLLLYSYKLRSLAAMAWPASESARQSGATSIQFTELLWSNLRGSARTIVSRADRVILPILWPASTFAGYDCARRAIDRINGLGRPLADALLDRHLANQGAGFEGTSVRMALQMLPVSLMVSIAVGMTAQQISTILYGSVLGKVAAPMLIALCPLCLLLSQSPILPILSTSSVKRSLTMKSMCIAVALAVALCLVRSNSPLLSALFVTAASLGVGILNMQAALKLRSRNP